MKLYDTNKFERAEGYGIPVICTDMGSVVYMNGAARRDGRLSRFSPFRSLNKNEKKKLLALGDRKACAVSYPPRMKQRFALVYRSGELFTFLLLPMLRHLSALPCDFTEEDGETAEFISSILSGECGIRELILKAASGYGAISVKAYGRVLYLAMRYLYGEDLVDVRTREQDGTVDAVSAIDALISASFLVYDMKMTELISPPVTVEAENGRLTVWVRGGLIYEERIEFSEIAASVLRHFVCEARENEGAFALAIAIELAPEEKTFQKNITVPSQKNGII